MNPRFTFAPVLCYITYQERQREWPYDALTTCSGFCRSKVPNPARVCGTDKSSEYFIWPSPNKKAHPNLIG